MIIVAIPGGFEIWPDGRARRPKYRFDRRAPVGMDPVHRDWWLRHGADCEHPPRWVMRGRCLLPEPVIYVVLGNPGSVLHWDECLMCGARFNQRFRSPIEGAVPLRDDVEEYRRRSLRDEAIAAGLLQEAARG